MVYIIIYILPNISDFLFYSVHINNTDIFSSLSDDLPKLQYFTQCLKESLRITPPVPGIGRQITKTLTFPDGRSVPEGEQYIYKFLI